MPRYLCLVAALVAFWCSRAQELPLKYHFGEKYPDGHAYSNLLLFAQTASGEKVLVRSYYSGLLLRPKGYLIERYNDRMELLGELEYESPEGDFISGFVANGQLFLLFLEYDPGKGAYTFAAHQSPVQVEAGFTRHPLLSIPGAWVENALGKNYYNRDFSSGFTTAVLRDPRDRAFAISLQQQKGEDHAQRVVVFNNRLERIMDVDFSGPGAGKNYAFEEMAVAPDLSAAYLVGKAYFRKRRFKPEERRYQYEVLRLQGGEARIQAFDLPGTYSEAIKPLWKDGRLVCAGFYADRADGRYNGIQYLEMDPVTLAVRQRKQNPFPEQFMLDKFGTETEKVVRNLVFKGASFTEEGALLFNAEEYFVTESMQARPGGGRMRVERFHHNDIVSAKLDPGGAMEWARNINKAEVTQGDGSYISYSSHTSGGETYFFICSAMDQPQLINNERLIFKQGLGKSRNLFAIRLDAAGALSYEKLIDAREARLPLMVSRPLVDKAGNRLFFYAKRGGKKQLLSVTLSPGTPGEAGAPGKTP